MNDLQKVPGVGPALAKALSEKGIPTKEQLAQASVDALLEIPRLGRLRAAALIDAAAQTAKPATTPDEADVPDASAHKRQRQSTAGPSSHAPVSERAAGSQAEPEAKPAPANQANTSVAFATPSKEAVKPETATEPVVKSPERKIADKKPNKKAAKKKSGDKAAKKEKDSKKQSAEKKATKKKAELKKNAKKKSAERKAKKKAIAKNVKKDTKTTKKALVKKSKGK